MHTHERALRIGRFALVATLCQLTGCAVPLGDERTGPLTLEGRYEVLYLHPAQVDSAARNGRPISLTLGGSRLVLQLMPKNLVAPECRLIDLRAPTLEMPCPRDLGTYSGAIDNESEWSQVRLSVLPQGVVASIRTEEVTWMIEPRPEDDSASGGAAVRHIAYRTDAISGALSFEGRGSDGAPRARATGNRGTAQPLRDGNGERSGCDPEDRPCRRPPGSTPPPAPSFRTLGLALAADRQYVGQARVGMNFVVRQAATLNLVDGMYRREGIGTFQIVAVIADPLDQFFGSNVATNLLNGIVPAFANANLNISVAATRVARNVSAAFLTSGKPPDRSVPGQVTIGLANQPGITGMAFQDLSLGVGVELGGGAIAGGPNEWQNFMVMAHELGHIYNADHDEAEEFCRNFWIICWNKGRTVMWPMFTFRTTPYFSRGSNDATHNNWRRILDNLMMRSP